MAWLNRVQMTKGKVFLIKSCIQYPSPFCASTENDSQEREPHGQTAHDEMRQVLHLNKQNPLSLTLITAKERPYCQRPRSGLSEARGGRPQPTSQDTRLPQPDSWTAHSPPCWLPPFTHRQGSHTHTSHCSFFLINQQPFTRKLETPEK